MRNLFKYAVMSAMLICTLPVYGVTVRDNYLYFSGGTLKKWGWHESHRRITEGQPWEYTRSSYNEGLGILHIRAGRKGSEDVAEWFKERAMGGKVIRTDDLDPSWPSDLNFATNGHMNLVDTHGRTAQCRGIVIGQGHGGGAQRIFNYWWLAGENLHEYGGEWWLVCPPVHDPDTGTDYCGAVVPISAITNTHEFKVSFRMCPPAVSMSLSPDELWPANGKMVEIEATIDGGDGCGNPPVVILVSIDSSELESGTHGRDVPDDILDEEIGTDDRTFQLRAEHSGDGRLYTATYDIVDGCGVVKTLEATVTMPKNRNKNKKIK